MQWMEFSLALGAFLGSHVIPARLREPLTARLGRRAYLVGYSLLSLGLLYWLIMAAGRAPFVELWPQQIWMRWLVNLIMPAAILAACLGGMAGLMAAFVLWSGAHLLANGDLAHAILFGLLFVYSVFGLAVGLRRGARFQPTWPRLALAVALWAVLLHFHAPVIGVSPLP